MKNWRGVAFETQHTLQGEEFWEGSAGGVTFTVEPCHHGTHDATCTVLGIEYNSDGCFPKPEQALDDALGRAIETLADALIGLRLVKKGIQQ